MTKDKKLIKHDFSTTKADTKTKVRAPDVSEYFTFN